MLFVINLNIMPFYLLQFLLLSIIIPSSSSDQKHIIFHFLNFLMISQISQILTLNFYTCLINYETMTTLSATKQQLLQQINQSKNAKVHPSVKCMLDKLNHETYSLSERFKNLEDPLKFIHNQSIQNLVEKTQQSSFKLKKQMEDVSQFSKSMFKKIIARQGNEFDFENIKEEGKALKKSQIKDTQIIKAQGICKSREAVNTDYHLKKEASIKQMKKMQVFQPLSPIGNYKHKIENVRQTKGDSHKNGKMQLNYGHIKLLDTPEFDTQCSNLEFYEMLKSLKTDRHHLYNQDYNIEKSSAVNRLCDKIPLEPIGNDSEYGPFSQVLYYDFDLSLKFWKQGVKKGTQEHEEKEKITDEGTLALFEQFRRKQISLNNVCDIAMGKITVDQLRHYFRLRNSQKVKQKGKSDQAIQKEYFSLLKQYNHQNELKTKLKSQRIPVKYLDSDSQTIKILDQTDFDHYFNQDFKQLFDRISKLSQVRQNAMTNKKVKNRIVIIKNSCQDICQCLFKLTTLILKGEKFYPRQKANEQYYAPFFTYRDLFDVESRDEVERKILELIYSKINQFECEFVDEIPKIDLITIYVQQRQKTNRILEIVSAQ